MRAWPLLLLLSLEAQAGALPEAQLALTHLRAGEKERAAQVLGPLDALPLYLAELSVEPKTRVVTGRVRLRLVADAHGLSEVVLRGTPNAFGAQRLKVTEVRVNGAEVEVDQPEPTLYRLELPTRVTEGGEVWVTFVIRAQVPKASAETSGLAALMPGGGGAGRGDHGAFSATPDVMSLVGVLPGVVPRDDEGDPVAGPTGIGDLALYVPANYLVSISVPSGWRAVTTGVALGEVPDRTGTTRFSFGAAAVRDFPVFATRGFDVTTAKAGDISVESHSSTRTKAAAKHALKMAVDSLEVLEKRLGPLPWKVFRVVEAPLTGGAGGMEFPGLVTISRALYESATPGGDSGFAALQQLQDAMAAQGLGATGVPDFSALMRSTLEFTVAHEVAHQYFAALVASDPVNHPVVDEALAQHTALLVMEWTRGKAAADAIRQSQLVTAYQFYRMGGGEDGPADRPTGDFEDELEYGALVYGKAPLLHDAQRKLVGDKAHFAALKAYVETHRHRWADPDGFTETLARLNPDHAQQLRKLHRRWLSQAYGDEDLGTADLGALLRNAGGASIPPETLELLQQLLQQTGP